jgi:peptidoglycan/LPS O-acetylase OafA/YrhL
LALELWFYLLVPLVLKWRTSVLVLIVLAFQAIRFMHPIEFYGDRWPQWFYAYVHIELGTFVAGALSYRLYDRFVRGARIPPVVGWGVLAGMLALGWNLDCQNAPNYFGYLLLTICALPLMFAATRNNGIDRFLAEFSYPVYLTHFLFIDLFKSYGMAPAWIGVATLASSFLASLLLLRLIDMPVHRWRARYG